MDVTSLLNTSSAAALQRRDSIESSTPSATGDTTATSTAVPTPSPERTPPRRTSGSRSPNRNRTPWDAGGYSLPLSIDTKSIPSFTSPGTHPRVYHNSNSPIECGPISSASPKSPKHKFSDSHSSLGSYTSSSTNSLSHSRISSLSTVSEFQPLTSLITDISLDGGHLPPKVANSAVGVQPLGATASFESTFTRRSFGSATSLDPIPPYNNHHFRSSFDPSPPHQSQDDLDSLASRMSPPHPSASARPDSPSDAVMIRRGLDGLATPASPNDSNELRSNPSGLLAVESSPVRSHKRAVSAPDFPAPVAPCPATTSTASPTSDATASDVTIPSASQNYTWNSSLLPADYRLMFPVLRTKFLQLLARLDSDRAMFEAMICGKKEICEHPGMPCTLNSQPRKAISHLFGRNKLCTRSVPSFVWVHYCRKHYQRCRYRASDKFSVTQAKLVTDTIWRVQMWSDMNKHDAEIAASEGKEPSATPQLIDWSLSTRKREQKRMDDKNDRRTLNGNNKRRRPQDDDEDDDSDDEDPNFDNGLAVDGWLLDKCGSGYSTLQMLEIACRIKSEIDSGQRTKMPDIEILPNILVKDKDHAKTKVPVRRKASAGHKRSQSMGVAMHSQNQDPFPMARRVSQPNVAYWRSDDYPPHIEKRQRLGEVSGVYQGQGSVPAPRRTMERTVPSMHSIAHLQPRPMIRNIRENQAEEGFFGDSQLTATTGVYSYGPLPAPTSQGLAGPALTPTSKGIEQRSRYEGLNRPAHQRSFSDASSFQYTTPNHRSPGSSSYSSATLQLNSYPSVSNGFDSASSYAPDYTRQEGNSYLTSSMPGNLPSMYAEFSPRAQNQQQSYLGNGFGFHTNTGANNSAGNAYSGGAKHTRHQSTPVAPRLVSQLARGNSTLGSQHLADIHAQYNSEHSSFGNYATRHQPSYTSAHPNMPRVEEAEGSLSAKDGNYAAHH